MTSHAVPIAVADSAEAKTTPDSMDGALGRQCSLKCSGRLFDAVVLLIGKPFINSALMKTLLKFVNQRRVNTLPAVLLRTLPGY